HAGHHLDQRGLAGAVVADQADDLVAADAEMDVAQALDRAEELLHAFQAHDMLFRAGRLRPRRRRRAHAAARQPRAALSDGVADVRRMLSPPVIGAWMTV